MATENTEKKQLTDEEVSIYQAVLDNKDSSSEEMKEAYLALQHAGVLGDNNPYIAIIKEKIEQEKEQNQQAIQNIEKNYDEINDILGKINPLDEEDKYFDTFRNRMNAIIIRDEKGEEISGQDREDAINFLVDSAKLNIKKDLLSDPKFLESNQAEKELVAKDLLNAKLYDAQMQIALGYHPVTEEELSHPEGLRAYYARMEKEFPEGLKAFENASEEKPLYTNMSTLAAYYANVHNDNQEFADKFSNIANLPQKMKENLHKFQEEISNLDNRISKHKRWGGVYAKAKECAKALWKNKKKIAVNGLLGAAASAALISGGIVGAATYCAYIGYSKIHQPLWTEYKRRKQQNEKISYSKVAKEAFASLFKKQTDPEKKVLKAKLWGGIAALGLGGTIAGAAGALGVGALANGAAAATTKLAVSGAAATGNIVGESSRLNYFKKLKNSENEAIREDAKKQINEAKWSIGGSILSFGVSAYFQGTKLTDGASPVSEITENSNLPPVSAAPEVVEQSDTLPENPQEAVVQETPEQETGDAAGASASSAVSEDNDHSWNKPEYDKASWDKEKMGISWRQYNTLFNNAEKQFLGGADALENAYESASSLSPEQLAALGVKSPEELCYKFSRLDWQLGHKSPGVLWVGEEPVDAAHPELGTFLQNKLNLEKLLNCGDKIQEGGTLTPEDLPGMKALLAHIDETGRYHGVGDHVRTDAVPNGQGLYYDDCGKPNYPNIKGHVIGGSHREVPPHHEPAPEVTHVKPEPIVMPQVSDPTLSVNAEVDPNTITVTTPQTSWGEPVDKETVVNMGTGSENGHFGREKYLITQVVNAQERTGIFQGEPVVNVRGKLPDGTEFSETTFPDGHKVFGVKESEGEWNITTTKPGEEGIINGNAEEYLRVRNSFGNDAVITEEGSENGHNGSQTIGKGVMVKDGDGNTYVSRDGVNYQIDENNRISFRGDPKQVNSERGVQNTQRLAASLYGKKGGR